MKKQILIVSHNLRIGGVERSLLAMLNSFDYTKYSVDLFLYVHDGELFDLLPEEVNLLPEQKTYASWLLSTKAILRNKAFTILLAKVLAKIRTKIYSIRKNIKAPGMIYSNYLHFFMNKLLPEISTKKYDLCISYLTPHYIAANKFKSNLKIAWIHTDYSYFQFDSRTELNMWKRYDYIASISDACTDSFVQVMPELKDRIILIENMLSRSFIWEQSLIDFDIIKDQISKESINICSVGRFCDAKNFDNIPFICQELKSFGLQIKWYIIGYGADENLIRKKITETGMEEHVIILGKMNNPYPWIRACDIYVQPSRYEGKAVTVTEAQVLEKLVIITDYSTSKCQLNNGVDGIIVPLENKLCAQGIKAVIENKELQNKLIDNCKSIDFSNKDGMHKLYQLMNND